MRAVDLKTEHLRNPLGIDAGNPRVSWHCEGGLTQSAYELTALREGKEVFQSGIVKSCAMAAVLPIPLKSRDQITWRVRLRDEEGQIGEWSEATFEMGLLNPEDRKAKWINPEEPADSKEHKPASYLRRTFSVRETKNSRLYVTAHGVYEVWLNGARVGEFVLAPGTCDYEKWICMQTYDVTDLLRPGENVCEVILGDGWYRSCSGVDGNRCLFGEDLALWLQLEQNGNIVLVSDETWEATQEGPLRMNDLQQGETVDNRITKLTGWHKVRPLDLGTEKFAASDCVPIREHERFSGHLFRTPNGETVIDYGQNLAGYVEFTVSAHEGQTITFTHGETLDGNGNFTNENFQDRKRHKEGGIRQEVKFICREGQNHYKTKFSIWGFRYAKVETDIDLTGAVFTAIAVYSDMKQLGHFTCSDERVNQLVQNSLWSMKSNFCDVPTDCPTRERAAWSGDMGVFAPTGTFLMDCVPVIRKWLKDCRYAQHKDGKIANIAPRNNEPSFFSGLLAGSVGWGDACILVPWALYQATGDKKILEENYEMMTRWYAYLESRAREIPKNPVKLLKPNPYRDYTIETGIDYGEWCEPDQENVSVMGKPQTGVATAYFAYSGHLLAKIAECLGRKEDAEKYKKTANLARKAWRFAATKDGVIDSKRQADYVRAIAFHLLNEEERQTAADSLDLLVRENGDHLNTGFLSTPNLCPALSKYGHVDTAYRLLLQDTYPSWLYEVSKGATTIWERWDGISEEGKPRDSLNHYSYGAVTGWLFSGVAGIHVRADGKIVLRPFPNRLLKFAEADYHSEWGEIHSSWHYEGKKLLFLFSIPANCEAMILLPDGRKERVGAGLHRYEITEG